MRTLEQYPADSGPEPAQGTAVSGERVDAGTLAALLDRGPLLIDRHGRLRAFAEDDPLDATLPADTPLHAAIARAIERHRPRCLPAADGLPALRLRPLHGPQGPCCLVEAHRTLPTAPARLARSMIEQSPDPLLAIEIGDGRIVELNPAALRLFGRRRAELLGLPIDRVLGGMPCCRLDDHQPRLLRAEVRCADGETRVVEVSHGPLRCGRRALWMLALRALGERGDTERRLLRDKEFAEITLQSIQEAVITTDQDGRIHSANPAACRLLRREADQIVDRPLTDLLRFTGLDHRRRVRAQLRETLEQGRTHEIEGQPEIRFEGHESLFVSGRITPLRDGHGRILGAVVVLEDITAERRMREILSWQATHDDLTSLINRREFERRLGELLEHRAGEVRHVLLYLDLDQFKLINDNCGHDAGDQMLRQLTSHLGVRLRESDTFARLGGDEFAVLLPHCGIEDGRRIAEELRDRVRRFRFDWEGRSFGVGVSIGLVLLDDEVLTVTDALTAADSACYIAKERGRDQVVVYRPQGNEEQRRREEISQTALIRDALEQDRFCLWAQPILPIRDPEAGWGAEILVRMVGEDGRIIPPGAFIPGAERYNLMGQIDRWVVGSVCRQWRARPELFERLDKVAINLSGQSVANDEFLEFVIHEITAHRIPWQRLCFEITETAAVSSIEKARRFIRTLQDHGARFALDDFGSGLSSFAYLKQLPVDFLKIDGAFVKDMEHDRIDAAMVRSISQVGRAMDLRTIAEFVENESVIALLRDAEVDFAQGYGICRPMPVEALADYEPVLVRRLPASA